MKTLIINSTRASCLCLTSCLASAGQVVPFVNLMGHTCCVSHQSSTAACLLHTVSSSNTVFPAVSTRGECFCSAADFSHLLLLLVLPPQPLSCVNFIPDFFGRFFSLFFLRLTLLKGSNVWQRISWKVISAGGMAFCVRFLLSQEFYSQQCINGVIFYLSAACREMLLIQADKILICMLGSKKYLCLLLSPASLLNVHRCN